MQVPQIRIQSTFVQIGLRTNSASLEIQQPPADLSIEQPKAELTIRTNPSKLTIDQSQARADMDLKHISKRIEEAAKLGYEAFLEGIARRANEGEKLMKVENGGNAIANIAKQNSSPKIRQFNIGWIPKEGSVKIHYQPSNVEVEFIPRKPIIESKINKPFMTYVPGNVDISTLREPNLKIDFVNTNTVGVKI